MKKNLVLLLFACVYILTSCDKDEEVVDSSIKDGSGNVYTELLIGDQIWLNEDLKTIKYIDGNNMNIDSYEDNGTDGFSYDFDYDFRMEKLCPTGYKIPEKSDFETLIEYFGGEDLDSLGILTKYVDQWNANPIKNSFMNEGTAFYWTSTEYDYKNYYFFIRTISSPGMSVIHRSNTSSFHIRCIKE